jgi:hypothetical protein
MHYWGEAVLLLLNFYGDFAGDFELGKIRWHNREYLPGKLSWL